MDNQQRLLCEKLPTYCGFHIIGNQMIQYGGQGSIHVSRKLGDLVSLMFGDQHREEQQRWAV